MSRILARFLISLAASQWLYSELLLFYPDVDQVTHKIFQVIRIPTHDQWNATEQSSGMRTLARLFGRSAPVVSARQDLANLEHLTPRSGTRLVKRTILDDIDNRLIPVAHEELPYENLFDDAGMEQPFLSGSAIFGSRIDHAGFRAPI